MGHGFQNNRQNSKQSALIETYETYDNPKANASLFRCESKKNRDNFRTPACDGIFIVNCPVMKI